MLKRLILGLCLALLSSSRPAGAANWTYVNGASTVGNTVTLGFTPAAGSLLMVGCVEENSASSTLSITDNSSGPADVWTIVVPLTAGTQEVIEAWATNVTTGTAPTTVTCTQSAGGFVAVTVDNYTWAANPFVQDGSAAVSGSQHTLTPAESYTTGLTPGDLLWSFVGVRNEWSTHSITVASPFTIRQTAYGSLDYHPMAGSSDDGISAGVSASTLYTASYTLGVTDYSLVAVVGIKAPTDSVTPGHASIT